MPNVHGKQLGQARHALKHAHCALGKVKKPHIKHIHRHRPLVVASESPKPGTVLKAGAKVKLRLVQQPPK